MEHGSYGSTVFNMASDQYQRDNIATHKKQQLKPTKVNHTTMMACVEVMKKENKQVMITWTMQSKEPPIIYHGITYNCCQEKKSSSRNVG